MKPVTQAVPTMLEVLPVGHDKTTGFEALASRLARESGLAFRSGAETSDDAGGRGPDGAAIR